MSPMAVQRETAFRALLVVAAFASMQGRSSFRGAPAWDPKQTLESTDALFDGYLRRFFDGGEVLDQDFGFADVRGRQHTTAQAGSGSVAPVEAMLHFLNSTSDWWTSN